jgi:hypothetical protein
MQERIKTGKEKAAPPKPPVMSGEVASTQPALEALLKCLADTFNDYSEDTFLPAKKQLKQSQIIARSKDRPKQNVNICLTKPG